VTDEERIRRIGHNEGLYRQVNERIEELNEAFALVADDFAIVCECGDLACAEQIRVPRGTYEEVRQDPALFVVRPGHELEEAERVVSRHAEFVVVRKDPGLAERVAAETDPRG
jgi:hypothetical protein